MRRDLPETATKTFRSERRVFGHVPVFEAQQRLRLQYPIPMVTMTTTVESAIEESYENSQRTWPLAR